jgi:hypothetical protein
MDSLIEQALESDRGAGSADDADQEPESGQ